MAISVLVVLGRGPALIVKRFREHSRESCD